MLLRSLFCTGLISLVSTFAGAQSTSMQLGTRPEDRDAGGATTQKLDKIIGNEKLNDTHEITDAKMRAEGGSLSRYSMKTTMAYYGPTLSDLSAADQPNPDGSPGINRTRIVGSLSARYRLNGASSVGVGTGLSANHPFHGMDRFDVSNPYFSYDNLSRFSGWQMRNSPQVAYVTNPDYVKVGEKVYYGYTNSLVHDIGRSKFAAGFDTSVTSYSFDRTYRRGPIRKGGDGNASRYDVALYPTLKFNASDRTNFYTSVALKWWNLRARDDEFSMVPKALSQIWGMGYAYRRDIYFQPYLTTYPSNFSMSSTTFNFSTIFSVL